MFWDLLLPIFGLLLVGVVSNKVGFLTAKRVSIMNDIAFNFLVPVMVFNATYQHSFTQIFSPSLLLGYYLVYFTVYFISHVFFTIFKDNAKRSVAIIQSCSGNTGYMGLPLLSATLGNIAVAKASILLGLAVLVQLPLMMGTLIYFNDPNSQASFQEEFQRMFLNPIILGLLLGITFSHLPITLPSPLPSILPYIGNIALGIAMIGVGASLKIEQDTRELIYFLPVGLLKLVVMPILGWIFYSLVGISIIGMKTGIILLSMPTAVITFIYTEELGGDQNFASFNITLTTIFSIFTISILLFLLF